jgi:hypothetical protein
MLQLTTQSVTTMVPSLLLPAQDKEVLLLLTTTLAIQQATLLAIQLAIQLATLQVEPTLAINPILHQTLLQTPLLSLVTATYCRLS